MYNAKDKIVLTANEPGSAPWQTFVVECGTTLVFRNIVITNRWSVYVILADVSSEESSLVDMYIFDILVTYVESLSLAHDDDGVLGQH